MPALVPRFLSCAVAAFASLALLVVAMAAAHAQETEIERIEVQDWNYVCIWSVGEESGQLRRQCRINNQLWTDDEPPKLLFATMVRLIGKERVPVMIIRIPAGGVAGKPVRIRVDENQPLATPPAECGQSQCIVAIRLPEELLAQFRNGTMLLVAFPVDEEREARAKVSLLGFTRAFAMLSTSDG